MASVPNRKHARRRFGRLSQARLDAMIAEATVDAYNHAEQATGFFTMIEDHLACPFPVTVLGRPTDVLRVDMDPAGHIVAVCASGSHRQSIPILDFPLPDPLPAGAEWIEAYRRWVTTAG